MLLPFAAPLSCGWAAGPGAGVRKVAILSRCSRCWRSHTTLPIRRSPDSNACAHPAPHLPGDRAGGARRRSPNSIVPRSGPLPRGGGRGWRGLALVSRGRGDAAGRQRDESLPRACSRRGSCGAGGMGDDPGRLGRSGALDACTARCPGRETLARAAALAPDDPTFSCRGPWRPSSPEPSPASSRPGQEEALVEPALLSDAAPATVWRPAATSASDSAIAEARSATRRASMRSCEVVRSRSTTR